jgi:hypothetical protein
MTPEPCSATLKESVPSSICSDSISHIQLAASNSGRELVDAWAIDRELADWIATRLKTENAALQAARKQIAALEAELGTLTPPCNSPQ